MSFADRLSHAWNAFKNKDPSDFKSPTGVTYNYRPDRPRFTRGTERSMVNAVYTRIATDAAAIKIEHVQQDSEGRYISTINSGLNTCLTLEANIDQTGRAFRQDVVMSLLDEGGIAVVPVETDYNPRLHNAFDVTNMRVGKIIEWKPDSVKVRLYNEFTGNKEELWMPKKAVCIIENPFYTTMNEPNSTMQRLIRKLSLLDAIDEQAGAGKLDLIIQLPYIVKSEARRQQAETRRKDIEDQLAGSKYGIAYTDGTEHITQLNRSVDNQLLTQIENLMRTLYSQLGLTEEIMNGSASEDAMNNYYSRTIEPILSAITDEMNRKFLTKNARTRGQSVRFFRDPFKLIPITKLADLADKFTRNEVLTSNEVRQIVGMKPASDPGADELRNKNMPMPEEQGMDENYDDQLGQLDDLDSQLDDLESQLN